MIITSSPVAVTNGGAFDGADVDVALGQSVTCSITNDDISPFIPSLTVVKTIVSDNGGSNTLDSFDVSVNGTEVAWTNPTSMLGGSQLITQTLGTYTLSENNMGEYTEGIWDCRDQNGVSVAVTNSGAFSGADIILATGQALICSITNDDDVPSYTMSKSAGVPSVNLGSNATITDKDDTITYTFTFVNTGTVDLVNLAVQDPLFGAGNVCTIASLAAGSTDNTSCVLTHTLTQADVDAASVVNTATSSAYAPDGTTVIAEDNSANDNSVVTAITQAPNLSILKSTATLTTDADSSTDISLGDTITYTVTATNDGNMTLNNVIVSDPELNPTSFTCLTVAPNAVCVLSGTHVVELDESNAGKVVNTAGVVSDEITTSVQSNTVTTPVVQTLEFTMAKTSDTADIGVPGTITYTFTFTNTGNVDLTDLTVADTNIDAGTLSNCPISNLAPDAIATCTATRTISREQISAGDDIINTAIPSAKGPDGITSATEDNTADDNSTTTTITTWADVSVTKTLTTAGPYTSGQTISYEIVVTNSASSWSDATNVVVTDLPTNLTITNVSSTNCSALPCTIPLLNIGDSEIITVEATAP
ncbi:hypothetical protein [uncultured Cocleimonas sp.]|uniref:DUF7507 domain-containing protein n=1 Tax=uncultured Cocleimonas sp. TaxID=1051587 RepID=UPI0026305112|nr:hypothetical protein [uncultured Cocleimonas sp.]